VRGRFVDPTQLDAPHHPTRILVRFRSDISSAAKRAAHGTSTGRRVLRTYSGIRHLQLLEVPRDGILAALNDYLANPDVLYAEPDFVVHALTTPNDPNFGLLWGLANDGQTINGVPGLPGADIDARRAWDAWTGDPDFRVAVVDTGIDYVHPDLAANMWTNPLEIAGNLIDDDLNGFVDDLHGYDFLNDDGNPMDDHSHGSHVAGTIGAVGNNGCGVTGINWSCNLVALKFLDDTGHGFTSGAISAIEYIIDQQIMVSNNSWGSAYFSQALFDVIAATQAIDHIFVAAAGNAGADSDYFPSYPAAYSLPNIISVAATNNRDELASFSNFGALSVDLGAPGVSIYSTVLDAEFDSFRGTSMASPHVAGVVALVRSRLPIMSGADVKARILDTVRPVADLLDTTVSGGVVNAFVALDDCNRNGLSDLQEIADETVEDCTGNNIPDECEPDCNINGTADSCDIDAGDSEDCTGNHIPDECEPDCDGDGLADSCELAAGLDVDCNYNGVPDGCEPDCNGNGIADACDISSGFSIDCTENTIPDECEPDCNDDGLADSCGIDAGVDEDCNRNGIPDECDVETGDCNGNLIPDECEMDCNGNGVADECDVDWGSSADCTGNGVPDECELDCNENGVADSCDIAGGTLTDSDGDGVADECVLGFSLVPVDASGPHTIDGNEIRLHTDGQKVFLEAQLYGWDPLQNGSRKLRIFQVAVDPETFENDIGEALQFARIPCTIDAECPDGYACPGTCTDGFCDDQSAFVIDTMHSEYVFRDLDTFEATFCNVGLPPLAGAMVWDPFDSVGDSNVPQYGVTITIDAPTGVQGTFVVRFLEEQTFWIDDSNISIPIPSFAPVVIVLPQDCNGNGIEDADDIASGTSQDCNDNGVPDECLDIEGDCNGNMNADPCDIIAGISADLNGNGIPDECEPGRLFVDAGATGLGTGESWADAFTELDDALTTAEASVGSVQEIWVAAGTYTPTVETVPGEDRAKAFSMIDGLAIYGGFAGYETDLAQRDIDANETIFSGDLNGDDGLNWSGTGENSYHVVVATGVDETAVLDGVTVTAGYASGGATANFNKGGGLFTEEGSPTVSNCTFVANFAFYGGGMATDGGSPTVSQCLFVDNVATDTGALWIAGSVITLDRCRFLGNTSLYRDNGGIRISGEDTAEVTLVNCLLSGNVGLGNGGSSGGGAIINSLGTTTTLINCTVVNNLSPDKPAGLKLNSGNATVINSIVWGNLSEDELATVEEDQITMPNWGGLTSVISHSRIEGWTGELGGIGNSGDDPLFADAAGADGIVGTLDDDLRLTSGSLSIDAGENGALPPGSDFDLDGNPRVIGAFVDIGAYEYWDPPDCTMLNNCSSHGVCVADGVCLCDWGYSGLDCSTFHCDDVNNCSGHGTCEGPNICDCEPGYSEPDCSVFMPIPTTSAWGNTAMLLLLLVAATIVLRRRGAANVARS